MAVALRQSGKSLQLVKQAYGELQKGQLKAADKLLAKIGGGGSLLSEEIDYLLRRYKVVQRYYQEKDNTLTHHVNDLYEQERKMKRKQAKTKSELRVEENALERHKRKLEQIQGGRKVARFTRLTAGATGIGAAVGIGLGAVLTLVAPPIGLIIVAVAGGTAIGSGVITASAQGGIKLCNRNIKKTQEKISTTKNTICDLGRQINRLSSNIKRVESERDIYHTENTKVREVVAFLQRARAFWSEFSAATQAGTQRTNLLQKLIAKAEKKEQYTILNSRGVKRVAQSFLEAWDDFEEMANTGENYLFKMEFTCVQCSASCNELPHLVKSVVCERCKKKQKVSR